MLVVVQEEEALAQALANGNMGTQDDLPPEEEEQLGDPEDEAQQETLEQVCFALLCFALSPHCYDVCSLLQESCCELQLTVKLCQDLKFAVGCEL